MTTNQILGPDDVFRAWAKVGTAVWDSSLDFFRAVLSGSTNTIHEGELLIPNADRRQVPRMTNVKNIATGLPLDENLFFVQFVPPDVPAEATGYGSTEVEATILAFDANQAVPAGMYVGEVWVDHSDITGQIHTELLAGDFHIRVS